MDALAEAREREVQRLLGHFANDHLPPHLAHIAAIFRDTAHQLADELTAGPELCMALRRLWDAKNCAVMHAIDTGYAGPPASPLDGTGYTRQH